MNDTVETFQNNDTSGVPLSRTPSDHDIRYSATSTRIQSMDLTDTKKVDEPLKSTKEEIPEPSLKSVRSEEPESASAIVVFSPTRRYLLLIFFCLAQFLDIFNLSALFSAIPTIAGDLDMTGSESVWTVSALQLTFASFLLVVSPPCSFIPLSS